MDVIDQIRYAAFELRQTDPQEAVKLLRKAAAEGGDAEVLARGALGEIYLEEFGDLDGAASEFRRVLQLAPGLAAAELGLARTLRESGDFKNAIGGFERALASLQNDLLTFSQGQVPAGAEEVALTALETAVELAELLGAQKHDNAVSVPLDEDALRWAESVRLFDEDEGDGAEERSIGGDWVRFHALWTRLRLLTGRGEEALVALREAKTLPDDERERLIAMTREDLGLAPVVKLGKKE